MKRGGALILAIWIIAVLSIIVLSFATEAHLQTGLNVYVRERNGANRLIEPGRILGEIVLLGFNDVKEPEIRNGEPDWKDIFDEEDRWCKEKYALKNATRCTIGPILLDEENPESGTVKVDIELANSGSENGININELYAGGDQQWVLRWQMILEHCGIDEELEVEVPEPDGISTKRHNLMNLLLASWNDWRDEDDNVSRGPISENDPEDDDGAETAWYELADEEAEKEAHGKDEREAIKEERRRPRNGSIPDVKELQYIRGFRDFPAVLTGGLLHPKEEEGPDNPRLSGISGIFGTSGSSKLVLNPQTTVDQLLTIPGIYPENDDDSEREDSQELARAILDTLFVEPEDADTRASAKFGGRTWWPYKDWGDLCQRLEDASDVDIGEEAQQYIEWQPSEKSVFKMKITAESMGMKREVTCECYVKDKKVRYTYWRED